MCLPKNKQLDSGLFRINRDICGSKTKPFPSAKLIIGLFPEMRAKKPGYMKPSGGEVAIPIILFFAPGTLVGFVFMVINKTGKVLSSRIIHPVGDTDNEKQRYKYMT